MKITIFTPPPQFKFASVKNAFLLSCFLLLFLACRKDVDFKEPKNAARESDTTAMPDPPSCGGDWNPTLRDIAYFITQKAYDYPQLRKWIYQRCHEQQYGDYDTKIKDIADYNESQGMLFWDAGEHEQLEQWLEIYKCSKGADALLFIPHIEEIDPDDYFKNNNYPTGSPEVVFRDEYDENTATAPSYILAGGVLDFYSEGVEEEYAWANDVWVFGEYEDDGLGASGPNPNDNRPTPQDDLPPTNEIVRTPGHKEFAGYIQVTNMDALEDWTHGKFEFTFYVSDSYGITINEHYFGRYRRKNFKNQRWACLQNGGDGRELGFWDPTVNWGPMHIERWTEADFGGHTVNEVAVYDPGPGFTLATANHAVGSNNYPCGFEEVWFSDPALPEPNVTSYHLNGLNFRRRTEP